MKLRTQALGLVLPVAVAVAATNKTVGTSPGAATASEQMTAATTDRLSPLLILAYARDEVARDLVAGRRSLAESVTLAEALEAGLGSLAVSEGGGDRVARRLVDDARALLAAQPRASPGRADLTIARLEAELRDLTSGRQPIDVPPVAVRAVIERAQARLAAGKPAGWAVVALE